MYTDSDYTIVISTSQLRDLTEKGVTLLSSGIHLRIATKEEGRDLEGVCAYLKGVGYRVMPTWEQLKAWMSDNGYTERSPNDWVDSIPRNYCINWQENWALQEMSTNISRIADNAGIPPLEAYNAIMGIK